MESLHIEVLKQIVYPNSSYIAYAIGLADLKILGTTIPSLMLLAKVETTSFCDTGGP